MAFGFHRHMCMIYNDIYLHIHYTERHEHFLVCHMGWLLDISLVSYVCIRFSAVGSTFWATRFAFLYRSSVEFNIL